MAETAGIHLRETRANAREIKFVVEAARAPEVQAWMRANLAPGTAIGFIAGWPRGG